MKWLYWDCTCFGRHHPDGIGRFTVAMAEARYRLPSRYLLPPYLADGALHRELLTRPGEVVIADRHPRRRYPWRWYWEQVLDEPGIVLAPGNYHRPCRAWPTITVVHDLIPYRDAAYAGHAHIAAAGYRRLLERDRLLAISGWTRDDIQRFAPAAAPARVIGQGLFPRVAARAPNGAPEGGFYLHVGGAEPRKRLERAVDLAMQLADAPMVCVGRDWPDRRVAALLAPLGARAIHLPSVDDAGLAWLYGSCRAVLLTTRSEGFGLIGLEALRAGRPVIASALTSLPEVLGGHALWIAPEGAVDASALRQAIAGWTPSAALDAHLGTFTWERARGILADTIDELVSSC